MNFYSVRFKHGPSLEIKAYDYTEDAQAGRIYFHKLEDKSDQKNFFLLSEVTGIIEVEHTEKHITLDELKKRMKDARA